VFRRSVEKIGLPTLPNRGGVRKREPTRINLSGGSWKEEETDQPNGSAKEGNRRRGEPERKLGGGETVSFIKMAETTERIGGKGTNHPVIVLSFAEKGETYLIYLISITAVDHPEKARAKKAPYT